MTRTTIDYGIDLGTTNSAIARFNGAKVEVFRNDVQVEITPSVVYLDVRERLVVGRGARERMAQDPDNGFSEFKRDMGRDREYVFKRNGRRMKPEELSAEVLKALKEFVLPAAGEEVQAAVITVPADFKLPQTDATLRAARLAGLVASPLLQEPIAAGLSYGLQRRTDRAFWLVFDLGGGTFDAAILELRDGQLAVVNHGGDAELGGKNLDKEIVDQIWIPAVARELGLSDFARGNDRWKTALARLELEAEQAKIQLSYRAYQESNIELWPGDDRRSASIFEYNLKRPEVERLAEPLIRRSINICRKVLAEKGLGADDIEKILLVGGPTLMPYLRELLPDPKEGLGIPLEFSIDPMTVVAQGAAIFAGTQRLAGPPPPTRPGQFTVELEYSPVGTDDQPPIGGIVRGAETRDLSGFTLELLNTDALLRWRSAKLTLTADGRFFTSLSAEAGLRNTYRIELRDAVGTLQELVPATLTYTIGVSVREQILIHSVGVATADNRVDPFFEKGTPLPTPRSRRVHATAIDLKRGEPGARLRIPIVEGENERADRNHTIAEVVIRSDQVRRDVPADSEVQITLQIDESRIPRCSAYFPFLDEVFEGVAVLGLQSADPETLAREVAEQRKRWQEATKKVQAHANEAAAAALRRLEEEDTIRQVTRWAQQAATDQGARDQCHARLLDLKATLDEIEDALEWPTLVAEAEAEIGHLLTVVRQYDPGREAQAATLEREARQAMSEHSEPGTLRRKVEEMKTLRFSVLREQPSFWLLFFDDLRGMRAEMRDPTLAADLLAQGEKARRSQDIGGLRPIVSQLIELLAPQHRAQIDAHAGSTMERSR